VRERFAFAEARIPATLQLLRQEGIVQEAVILSTCNRVEIYACTPLDPADAFAELKEFLVTIHDYQDPLKDEIYTLAEPHSVQHLFRVACGLDSMVLGETEILGQLKKAYDTALNHSHTGPRLNKAFQRAFHVAKLVRTETSIQRGSISVASVAVELAEKIFESLEHRHVLVLGAGDTSEKTARALLSRGAAGVVIANRSLDRAQALAATLGGRAASFESWPDECRRVDIAISSTASQQHIVHPAALEPVMRSRRNQPLLLIDIAVPRDIDPAVNLMPNVYLYNVDDLQTIADGYLQQRREEIAQCERIIQEKVAALLGAPVQGGFSGDVRPSFGR
jgi:glutamyl-tRNA reductase